MQQLTGLDAAFLAMETRTVFGHVGSVCVVDPNVQWTVDPLRLASRSRNTPYAGRAMTGTVRHTIYKGEAVVVDGEAQR